MIYPERLKANDVIGICAPASPIDQDLFEKGLRFIKSQGLKIKMSNNVYKKAGYLAGTDQERLNDFHELLEDRSVKAIIFARGGYGTARFANDVDIDVIKRNPKIIWGFSDITYLHSLIYAKTKLITFHGPMIMTAGREEFDDLSQRGFLQLFKPTVSRYDEEISMLTVIAPGEANAPIVGGNLSLLVSTLGTDNEIEVTNKIIFIEELNEKIYKIDSMLNQLKLANKLNEVAGVVIGDFHNTIAMDNGTRLDRNQTAERLADLFMHYFSGLSVPVISGFKIGHCFPHFAIPHGANAFLSSKTKSLTVEAGVK